MMLADNNQKKNIQNFGTRNTIHFYKNKVTKRPSPAQFSSKFCIEVVSRAIKHEYSEGLERHEIDDVDPATSIVFKEIKDLFYPNDDTMGKYPRTILVIGPPNIGKTVLMGKIVRDCTNKTDEFYHDKMAYIFYFRQFNGHVEKFTNISLKKFLQLETSLSDDEFERIYVETTKEPQKALLIFDGLDEFRGNLAHCLDETRKIPNDPNICMSAMNFFVKLVQGNILKGATVVVTSRSTTDDFYSNFQFDRNVEILGFTQDKIKEYVARFCYENDQSDLKLKIWGHIQSFSELLSLCCIPINCFIVCSTLLACLVYCTSTLPRTLTEHYHNILVNLETHDRNTNGYRITGETLKKLQKLAFVGMQHGRFIFDVEEVDEHMRKSCLLHSLSNETFPVQAKVCFIHRTLQEFLAAKHVTETLNASKIKEFILAHVTSSKWHLVLQFIAGLLGEQIKMFDRKLYHDCVLAFTESLEVNNALILLNNHNMFLMKCVREVDDEIAKDIQEKYLGGMSKPFKAFNDDHCRELTELEIRGMRDKDVNVVWDALVCQRSCKLSKLTINGLRGDLTDQCIPILCNALQDKHCRLTDLTLENNDMGNKGARMLFEDALTKEHCKLNKLNLRRCLLTELCIPSLCEALQDESCQLIDLTLSDNGIGDSGACMLFEDGLTKEHCELTKLDLSNCLLTDQCISSLCKALQSERCELTNLTLSDNVIGDKGACMLFESALVTKHGKIAVLDLGNCSLTNHCIPSLLKRLQNEHCQLTNLSLESNVIGNRGARMLFEDGLTKEHCKLTKLNLSDCSLTNECIFSLLKALENELCGLLELTLDSNKVTEDSEQVLCHARGSCYKRGMIVLNESPSSCPDSVYFALILCILPRGVASSIIGGHIHIFFSVQ